MALPDWIKNRTEQWIIGTVIAIAAIVVPIVISNSTKPPVTNQISNTKGYNNKTTQILNSPGATVINNEIDPEALAKQLAKLLSDKQGSATKDAEIKALKATIERMQQEPADELKQAALLALNEGDTDKAVELMEESANSRTLSAQTYTAKAEKLSKEAAQDWIDIGNIAYLSDSQKALNAYGKATELDISNHVAWNRLGLIHYRLGNLDKAQQSHKKVIELAGGDKAIKAIAYGNLGNIYQTRSELDKAEEFYMKAIDIDKKLGIQEGMARQYSNLGAIYQTRGELDKAEEFHMKALDIDKKLGIQEGMAIQYGNLGIIYQSRGELDKAVEFYVKSLHIDEKLGIQEGMARQYSNLGIIYQTCGELDKAEEFHMKALDIDKKLGKQVGMASVYGNLGNIYETRGNLDKAEEFYMKAIDLSKELRSLAVMAGLYGNLGIIYKTRGEPDKAEEFYMKALDINKKLGIQHGMAIQYANLGIIYKTRGELDKACEAWHKCLRLFTRIGEQDKIGLINGWIAEYCKQDTGSHLDRSSENASFQTK